jgi:hypothetical protein
MTTDQEEMLRQIVDPNETTNRYHWSALAAVVLELAKGPPRPIVQEFHITRAALEAAGHKPGRIVKIPMGRVDDAAFAPFMKTAVDEMVATASATATSAFASAVTNEGTLVVEAVAGAAIHSHQWSRERDGSLLAMMLESARNRGVPPANVKPLVLELLDILDTREIPEPVVLPPDPELRRDFTRAFRATILQIRRGE